MILRLLLLAIALLVPACGGGGDGAPDYILPLPADQVVFDSDRGGNHEIYRMKSDGSDVVQMTDDPAYENWWARVSPDRRRVLFYRSPAGDPENYLQASLWVMNADGSGVTLLRAQGTAGWTLQGHGEWSPDGTRIAMAGTAGSAAEIFVTDAQGRNPVQYTNRGGINTDVSWSPDGLKLLFNGSGSPPSAAPAGFELYAMDAIPLSTPVRITNDGLADYDPYYSPDGTKIAWLVNVDPAANVIPGTSTALGRWAIRIATVGGPASYLIDDGAINSKPAWSLDSRTIYFHRMVPPDYRFRVFRINPDGSGLAELTPGATANSEHPSN